MEEENWWSAISKMLLKLYKWRKKIDGGISKILKLYSSIKQWNLFFLQFVWYPFKFLNYKFGLVLDWNSSCSSMAVLGKPKVKSRSFIKRYIDVLPKNTIRLCAQAARMRPSRGLTLARTGPAHLETHYSCRLYNVETTIKFLQAEVFSFENLYTKLLYFVYRSAPLHKIMHFFFSQV